MYIYIFSLYAFVHTANILAQFAFDSNRKNLNKEKKIVND